MTQKEKLLLSVLADPELQEKYNISSPDYEDLDDALHSDNAVVSAIAKIIIEFNGSDDPSEQKKVYKIIKECK